MSKAEYAKELLRREMEEISEDHYCAGWMMELEFDLWCAAVNGPHRYGMGVVEKETCDKLKSLAEDAGGWWSSCDKFTPMNEWLPMYSEFIAKHESQWGKFHSPPEVESK